MVDNLFKGGERMIIALEGIDNAGKTTLAGMLTDEFVKSGKNAIVSKELTTEVGKLIKTTIKTGMLTPISKTFLFAADRQLRIEKLQEENWFNEVVIFDRYLHSAIVYREAEQLDGMWVKDVNKNIPKSDIAFYIDITPEESIKRNTDTKFNIHYSIEHLRRVREAYLSYVELGELILIDGMKNTKEVCENVIDVLRKRGLL